MIETNRKKSIKSGNIEQLDKTLLKNVLEGRLLHYLGIIKSFHYKKFNHRQHTTKPLALQLATKIIDPCMSGIIYWNTKRGKKPTQK